MSTHKTIAKNTMFLYIRMFLIMGITLYTSRIVLYELGISDYGVYNLVAGIVSMMGFFNAAMSSATQRYLAFDIGKNDMLKLQKTFSTSLAIHFGIGILILILAETIGVWYINNKMVFPQERTFAVNVVYQFSILTFFVGIIQVPFNALIIARERMNIYAYLSLIEVVLKLIIVFILVYLGADKLISYSILVFTVTVLIALCYQIYCRNQFLESRFILQKDKTYYKELISYSGWNLFGNIAAVSRGQGINILLNLFFGTVVNAAYAITNQVVGSVNLFVTNLQMAFNPQIIKSYSQGNFQETENLIFQGSKISFFLMLILVMPILLNTDFVLNLWLDEVPEYTISFVQLALIGILIDSLSGTLMTGVQATGNIKWYQIIVGVLVFMNLPSAYFVLKLGFEPYIVLVISIIISIFSLQFRLYFLKRLMKINLAVYYKTVFFKTILVSLLSFSVVFFMKKHLSLNVGLSYFIVQSFFLVIVTLIFIICFGLNKKERELLKKLMKNKLVK